MRSKLIMTTDDKIIDEKYDTILTEKQQKYKHYCQGKFISTSNILQVSKYYLK